jgi:hypothetical protein
MAEASDGNLNTRIRTPADLIAREHYVATLEVNDPELAEVLERYHFDYEYPCGRAGCGRGHKEGFLVKVASGQETNIGWLCGKRVFGDDFTIKANEQQRRANLAYQIMVLDGVRSRKSNILQRISELLNRRLGVKWASKTLKSFNEIIGPKAVRALHERARRDDGEVNITREATGLEREDHKFKFPAAKPLQYIEERLGAFTGLEFFKHDPDCAMTGLKDKLFALERIDPSTLSTKMRQHWVDWAVSIDRVLDQAEQTLADSLRFFSQANLDLALTLDNRKSTTSTARWSESEYRFIVKK